MHQSKKLEHLAWCIRYSPASSSPARPPMLREPARQDRTSGPAIGFIEQHVCDGCPHAPRCAQGLACAAMAVFVARGTISKVAPRQPSAAIYARLFR